LSILPGALGVDELQRYETNQLLKIYIHGVPLDLASKLLPLHTCLSVSLLAHIHFHARTQTYFAGRAVNTNKRTLSRLGFLGIIDSLEAAIRNLKIKIRGSAWGDYYKDTNYSSDAFEHKKQLVSEFLSIANPKTIWDIGANTGIFSRIASNKGILTNSLDSDPVAVERNYQECVAEREPNILPLLIDVINPSPGIGWHNRERMSLAERGPADAVLALAVIHHLAIVNNVPFGMIASYFTTICKWLIIEFVPKNDSQVQRLLATREDIFSDYTRQVFEHEFGKVFIIVYAIKIKDSERRLYLMRGK
jgi:ribosomal protein L11 methylase PrmA